MAAFCAIIRGILRKILSKLLLFLEIIGLYRPPPADAEAQLARFRLYHAEFRNLLSANDSFLRILSDLEKTLSPGGYLDYELIRRQVLRAASDVHRMVLSLNVIAENRYAALFKVHDRLTGELHDLLEQPPMPAHRLKWVLPISRLHAGWSWNGGGKMANLGELRNRLHLPTPDGFLITVGAYRAFIESAALLEPIRVALSTIGSTSSAAEVSQLIQSRILSAEVPLPIAEKILDEYDALARRVGVDPTVAVRSSAVGEDGLHSFAGVYRSILGVERSGLLRAYLEVAAGLFSVEALHYRMLNNLSDESPAMAAGVLTLVEPMVSGVVYSLNPNSPESEDLMIQAVLGLGIALVDGRTSPEVVVLSRDLNAPNLKRRSSAQQSAVICDAEGATEEVAVPAAALAAPLLSDDEAYTIARHALEIERHFGEPQDIEWALDKERQLFFLQARPLTLSTGRVLRDEPRQDAVLLLSGGDAAFPGVGTGPAIHMDENSDLETFPMGGVLVAPRSSPRFVRLMNKARAIVTDSGSTTGHMASLCRELKIPALLNTQNATHRLPAGQVVTVDAQRSHIYAGEVEGLSLKPFDRPAGSSSPPSPFSMKESPCRRIFDLVVPLHLADPHSSDFQALSCETLHDVTRFVHETVYGEMFGMGSQLGEARSWSCKLDIFLPIDLYVIDLGGGLSTPLNRKKIKMSNITSVPLSALLRGMTHEKIPRFGPRSIDLGGFFSVMMRHAATAPEQEQTFRDPCYAMCSDHYLNYTARVGYHFGIVDSYCGKTPNKNYIHLHFRGGGADFIRRNRRARTIAQILSALGLSANVDRDMVNARANRKSQKETARLLELIGRLLQFVRQIDASMSSEDRVALYRDAFLNEDYDLTETFSRKEK